MAEPSNQTTQKRQAEHTPRPSAVWQVRPSAPPDALRTLIRELQIPPLLASVLWARGFRGDALSHLTPPLALTQIPDLEAAAARLEHALKHKKRILIHGDYDADGITGTAVLTLGLRELGGNVTPFIPHRVKDGYGISPDRVDEHIANADLFITVDCGIANLDELAHLQAAGVEVIVSDHHHPGQSLPDCLIVHPKMSPLAKTGLPELTGAGVAYHLLWALRNRLKLEPPLDYSDLASIGTIADVAPLMGENRALIVEGLEHLKDSRWPGLKALIGQSHLSDAPTATDVAFVLAPRLNAAGRMGDADMGLELLMTASERRARELAVYLQARNTERRDVQQRMFEEALEHVNPAEPAIVVADDGWHAGVMGIVASKLLERFYKPVFIIAGDKGSVRSTPGISAVNALNHAASTLKRYGGHSQAAGFALNPDDIPAFRDAINTFVADHPAPRPSVVLDALVSQADMSKGLLDSLDTLEPFGQGHRAPLFGFSDQLDMARAVGKTGTHLQLRVGGVKGIAWQRGEQAETLTRRDALNVAMSLRENEWQGKRSIEFEAHDLRSAEPLPLVDVANDTQDDTHQDDAHQDIDTSKQASAFTIKRGQPEENYLEVESIELEQLPKVESNATILLSVMPLNTTSLTPIASLRDYLNTWHNQLKDVRTVYVNLAEAELARLEQHAQTFPDVASLRRLYIDIKKRGQRPAKEDTYTTRALAALRELELLDELGRAKIGVKRDPYTSETLVTGLLEQYRLRRFVQAYKHLDDAGFAQAFQTLILDA
ncbi:MAG: single-stranded-DNA-specific exonuclease RecJ [Deinococcota bacterium]